MPFPGQSWPLRLKAIATLFHALAITSGIFRSTYRWYISRFGWDDTWASLAVLTEVWCLICSWLQRSVPLKPSKRDIVLNWISVTGLNTAPWEARLSMIASLIRMTHPHASVRRTYYAITTIFVLMCTTMLSLKLYGCGVRLCRITHDVAITQLIIDLIADALLVFAPILFLKGVKISRDQRVLLVSSFASSICVTFLSIGQFVPLLLPMNSASLLFTHMKVALSVIICNLLVVTTFAYRFYHKRDIDPSGSSRESEVVEFTTVLGRSEN